MAAAGGPPVRGLRRSALFRRAARFLGERLTVRGRYVLGATAVFALLGVDVLRSQVFLLFAVCTAVLLVAAVFLLRSPPRVRFDCALPARLTAGRPALLRARVETPEGRAATDLQVLLRPPKGLFVRPPETLLDVAAGATVTTAVEVEAPRRGRYLLRGPTLRATDPLRLVTGRAVRIPDQLVLAYPRFWRMEEFDVPVGRRYQPGGIPLSSHVGEAIEFVGTREYREGDPIRSIHWRSWARRGEPVVKEYQEEYFCRIAIILDTFLAARRHPGDEASFEGAVSVVASIADYFSRSEHIVDILAAGPDLYEVSAGRSLAYLENILDVLACLEACPQPAFQSIGPLLFEKLAQVTTVVAVLLDWDDTRERFLRRVKAEGSAVRTIIVREGPTTKDCGAGEELGRLSLMSPRDVERAVASGEAHTGRAAGGSAS